MPLVQRLIFFVLACMLSATAWADDSTSIKDAFENLKTIALRTAAEVDLLTDQLKDQKQKNAELTKNLQERLLNKAEEAAKIDALDDSAAVFEVCRLVINVCPETILEPGKKAIEHGGHGGRSSKFWYFLMLKTFTFATLFVGVLWLIFEGLLGRYKTIFTAGAAAKQWLEQAEFEKSEANKEIQRLEKLRVEKMDSIQAVIEQIADVKEELKVAQDDYDLETAILHTEIQKLKDDEKKQAALSRAAAAFKKL
jgi:septal ring factor EnvC (AmiA/AmiB activator)